MKIVSSGLLSLAVALGATLIPATAHADSYSATDPAGDVSRFDYYLGSATPTPDPTRTDGDIVNSRVVHGPRRVTIEVRFRDLSENGGINAQNFRIVTKHRVRDISIVAGPGHWQGRRTMVNGHGKRAHCAGVHWSLRYGADLARVSVPRRCLGKPAWVRVGIVTFEEPEAAVFLDDANRVGSTGGAPTLGPRVHR